MASRTLFLLSVSFVAVTVQGQLVVDETLTPAQLVDLFTGDGISVSNVVFNGTPDAMTAEPGTGAFTQTGNLGLASGVMLSTGLAGSAIGPESNFSADDLGNNGQDPDLEDIVGGDITNYSILEFDAVPVADSLIFRYAFASEEYPNFVCSFNDAFAFFLSGPGISGPFSNVAISLALLSDGITPVTIATVNNGAGNDPDDPFCPAVNPEFYVDNTDGEVLAYGGFTTVLTARAFVQAGETYHLKLAIADAGGVGDSDFTYDSCVFLEAGSLISFNGATTHLRESLARDSGIITSFGPHPTTGRLDISLNRCFPGLQVIVRDALGRITLQRSLTDAMSVTLELDGPPGTYLVEISSNNGPMISRRVLKF